MDYDSFPPPLPRLTTDSTPLFLNEAKNEVIAVQDRPGVWKINQDVVRRLLNSNSLDEFRSILGLDIYENVTKRVIKDTLRQD